MAISFVKKENRCLGSSRLSEQQINALEWALAFMKNYEKKHK